MNPGESEERACKKTHPGVFFPKTKDGEEIAKAVCRRCPIRRECLDYAIRLRIIDGVFGGCTAEERRRMSRGTKVADLPKNTPEMKDCPACNRALHSSAFAVDRSRGDGLTGECKACRYDRDRRRAEARKEAS